MATDLSTPRTSVNHSRMKRMSRSSIARSTYSCCLSIPAPLSLPARCPARPQPASAPHTLSGREYSSPALARAPSPGAEKPRACAARLGGIRPRRRPRSPAPIHVDRGATPRPARGAAGSTRPGPVPSVEPVTTAPAQLPTAWRRWRDGWHHVVFLVLNLLTALAALVAAILVLTGVLTLPAFGTGILVLVPGMALAGLLARAERARVEAFLGQRIVPPSAPSEPAWRHSLLLTRPYRRAAGYAGVHVLWGLLTGALAVAVLGTLVAGATLPLYSGLLDEDSLVLGLLPLGTWATAGLVWLVSLALLALAPVLARGVTAVDSGLARTLLGSDPEEEIAHLAERVDSLTESRVATVDSVEAERRRIERDLHDGPQQRLVAIAMDLGMARDRFASDPGAAQELLDKAHAASKDAIVEMRQVARGIVPPILADRGLDAAVSALAARSPVPVTVEVGADVGRVEPSREAIAYFCVSELLTNVAKHARAGHATVRISRTPDARLVLLVEDDGVGGADPARGTGLAGLRQRVQAVDGRLEVTSPAGGPTSAVVTLPLPATVRRGDQ
ncbi:sensor histidine kinase [Georgenia wutianyii]|uniref:histidine kinase n=1 Tax=Georgenia wutianyii TaxID=2585135 RepID=A0ABX5VLY0_9MICO|nr:sensor histidine kinase [Georgenia wutianyii]